VPPLPTKSAHASVQIDIGLIYNVSMEEAALGIEGIVEDVGIHQLRVDGQAHLSSHTLVVVIIAISRSQSEVPALWY
jgi:hypothetical protein